MNRIHIGFTLITFLLLSGFEGFAAAKDKVSTQDTSSVIANAHVGKLRGANLNGVCVWKGIRYAKAPVGDLRFKAPVPVEGWTGVKDALQFGATSPQEKSGIAGVEPQSEDCLFLNVWSPAADGKKRPVMFWIHGGGFVIGSGSSPMYDGTHLAKNGDVVVVTINYRLGPLGFLYFKDIAPNVSGFESNLGIKDQIAALKWVKENIAAFGGDPETVTIFGESAGGTSVETLLAAPSTKGLFKRAIAESGPSAIVWSPQIATSVTKKFFSFLNLSPNDIQKLKTLPLDTLRSAEDKLGKYLINESDQKVFSPTVDGDLLPNDIYTCLNKKQTGDVALMIGTNLNESSIFASKKLNIMPDNAAGFEKYFAKANPDKEVRTRITSSYKNYPHKKAVLNVLTDAVFRVPAIRLAECQMNSAPVYMYRFEWTSSIFNTLGLRSFHGLEIPFVFGSIEGGFGKFLKIVATKKLRTRLIAQMQGAWINFAKYGDPNGKGSDLNWKPYSLADRNTMIFNNKTKCVSDPDGVERKAWDGVKYY